MSRAVRVSAVINTKNEEARIANAIGSVIGWVDEIVVVDMCSEDRTVDIARDMGAHVVKVDDLGYVEPARRLGIERASGDWILVLDADELVPSTLAAKFMEISSRDDVDVVVNSHLNYFMGLPIRNTGWGMTADRHPRFFRKGVVTYSERIHHATIRHEARSIELPPVAELSFVHFNYDDISHFIEKFDRYTTVEARLKLQRGERPGGRWRAAFSAARAFRARFLVHRGYSDGYRGLCLAWLMATYQIVVWAKACQLDSVGDGNAIRRRYEEVAERILAEHSQGPAVGRQAPDATAGRVDGPSR